MIIFFLLEGERGFVFLTRSLLSLDICKEVGIYLLLVRYLYLDLSLTISTSAFLKFAGAFFLFIKKPKQTHTPYVHVHYTFYWESWAAEKGKTMALYFHVLIFTFSTTVNSHLFLCCVIALLFHFPPFGFK